LARVQSETSLTLSGDLVGTVRYMSPEQTQGSRVLLDHRTDVYSLGVTLYELLTLRPAFAGNDRQELLRQIAFDEPVGPRGMNKANPAELETVVLKAMEKRAEDRYATAQELADDLRRILEDQPIRARRPSLAQRFRKWARRHRPVVGAAAAVLLLAAVVGAANWFWWAETRAATQAEVLAAFNDAISWQEQSRWLEAVSAIRRADSLLAGSTIDEEFQQHVRQRRKDLEMVARLENIRLKMAAERDGGFDRLEGDRSYAQAFREYGIDVAKLGVGEAAEGLLKNSISVQLAAGLDDWAMARKGERKTDHTWKDILAIARAADPDSWRNRLRDALQREDRKMLLALASSKDATRQPSNTLEHLGWALLHADAPMDAVTLFEKAQERYPGDFWINTILGIALCDTEPPQFGRAARYLTAAVAIRPASAGAYLNLTRAFLHRGRTAAMSQREMRDALAACKGAIQLDRSYAEAYTNKAIVLIAKHQPEEAIAACRVALRLKPGLAQAHHNLGIALQMKGMDKDAVRELRRACRLRPDLFYSYLTLGNILVKQKDRLDEAIVAYREAVRLKKDLWQAYDGLAGACRKKGRLDEAIAAYRELLRLKPNEAEYHNNFGNALMAKGRMEEAVREYREAMRIKNDSALVHYNLGLALAAMSRLAEAIPEYQEAIRLKSHRGEYHENLAVAFAQTGRLDEALHEFKEAVRLGKNNAALHSNLSNILRMKGKFDEAISECHQAILLNNKVAEPHNNLGLALVEKGRLDEAVAEYHTAIQLKRDFPDIRGNLGLAEIYHNLGLALGKMGRLDEAISAYREAILLKKDLVSAHNGLAITLRRKGQLGDAVAEFQRVAQIEPESPAAHFNLAVVLLDQGRFAEALAAAKRSNELGSRTPGWRHPSAQMVREAERWVELEAKLPKVLQGRVQPANVAERIALAELCARHKKRYVAAARFYAEAFAAQPALASDLRAQRRYDAACAAALASCGRGEDAKALGDKERARLRWQALRWLRAELEPYVPFVDNGPAPAIRLIKQRLQHWQEDTDFARVRADALTRLPQAEREAWAKLWANVADTLGKTQAKIDRQKKPGLKQEPTGKMSKGGG
jgi:tetratricopeptide (TPR) repeat protein